MEGNQCSDGSWGGRGGLLDGGVRKGIPGSSTHKGNIGARNLLRARTLPLESSEVYRKMLSESVRDQWWVLIKLGLCVSTGVGSECVSNTRMGNF